MPLPRSLLVWATLIVAGCAAPNDGPASNTLTPREIADGWLLLFDGETTFGWTIDGPAEVKDGELVLGGDKPTVATPTTQFTAFDARLVVDGVGSLVFQESSGMSSAGLGGGPATVALTTRVDPKNVALKTHATVDADRVDQRTVSVATGTPAVMRIDVPAGGRLRLKSFKLKPAGTKPLFDGKTLDGWKKYAGDPKRALTEFSVTPAGELSAKNGPGDLQTTARYADFVLQLECKTNGKWLNSGVFFRCLPDQYQNGYEAQIQNAYAGGDRTKPVDFGTGAIYRRVAARKVVSDDNEWFTLTVAARGPHLATWVNGYQTVDWTDERKPSDNPRQGSKTAAGHLSIQGHDPTTDLLFRNIRLAELPPTK